MKHKILYIILVVSILLFSAYGVLVNWRPYTTEGIFKFDCCTWTEDKPEKR